jgi:hypothetical protein
MASALKNNTGYDIAILTGLSIIGIIVKLAVQKTSQTGIDGPATASIWGYGIISISLIGMLFVTFSLATKDQINKSSFELFKNILTSSMPVLFIIGLVLWNIFMNITYKEQINKGRVSKDYTTFGYVSTALLTIHLITIFKYLKDKLDIIKGNVLVNALSESLIPISYLIGTFNLIVIGFMQVILDYLSTDG